MRRQNSNGKPRKPIWVQPCPGRWGAFQKVPRRTGLILETERNIHQATFWTTLKQIKKTTNQLHLKVLK